MKELLRLGRRSGLLDLAALQVLDHFGEDGRVFLVEDVLDPTFGDSEAAHHLFDGLPDFGFLLLAGRQIEIRHVLGEVLLVELVAIVVEPLDDLLLGGREVAVFGHDWEELGVLRTWNVCGDYRLLQTVATGCSGRVRIRVVGAMH